MSKKKIINKLRKINEDLPSSEDMRTNFKKTTDTMSNVVKSELGTDDEETKDIVSGILKGGISEVKDNSDFRNQSHFVEAALREFIDKRLGK